MDKIDICNLALGKVGELFIQDINDPYDENAKLCKMFFDPVLENAIRAYPWSFSIERTTLAESAEPPEFGFQHKYLLPNDCLRILGTENGDFYQIEGAYLVTDISPCRVKYQKKVSDLTILPSDFCEGVALDLAVKLSYTLTQSRTQTEALLQEQKFQWTKARNINAVEKPSNVVTKSNWLDGRLVGTTPLANDYACRSISTNVNPDDLVGGQ